MIFRVYKKETISPGTHQRVSLKEKSGFWNKINLFAIAFTFTWLSLFSPIAAANPTGGVISSGSATISNPDANTTVINQTSNKAIINWQTFNIAPNQTTRFQQPNAGSIAVNRVNPNNGSSTIAGNLTANGQIWILNPAGILITPTGRIDAAGFLATTAGISDHDFMSGNYHFIQSPDWNGSVINEGTISVADRGMAALVAPSVSNSGLIQANLGSVALASSNEYVVDFYGDQLIQFGVNSTVTRPGVDQNGNPMRDAVSNSGTVIANGGKVLMTADTAAGIVHSAVNVSGTVVANSASVRNGVITLSGGAKGVVRVSGKVMASGAGTGNKGGKITITGKEVYVDNGARIDATGDTGGGTVNIGGNYKGQGPLMNSDYAVIDSDAIVDASALLNGNGGEVILWSDLGTGFYGTILAKGGMISGNGGFVETSGKEYLEAYGHVYVGAPYGVAGTWLLDPRNVTISNTTSNGTYTAGVGFTPTGNNSQVNVASINTDLNAGSNIVINTGSTGGQAGNITVSAAVLKSAGVGTATLTLDAAGAIAINNTISATSGTLNLILTAGGAITQSAALTIAALTISAGANAVTLTNAANLISGAIGITNSGANNVAITNNRATDLGSISIGTGTFALTSAGAITQSGSFIQAASAGTATFTAGANAITLTNGSNDFTGAVVLSNSGANNVAVTDANALSIGTSSVGTGTLTLNSIGLSQTGAITQAVGAGAVTINAGAGSIALDSANTFRGAVSLNNSGANNVSLTNSIALSLGTSGVGSGTLGITAGGSITQTGAITQEAAAGAVTLSVNAAASDILLNTQANNFSGSIGFGGTLTNIRDVGLRNINAAATLASFAGLTNLRNLTIVFDNSALSLPAITLASGGSLSATAGGAITQTGVLTIPGTASFSAGANAITLTQNNAFTGAVSLSNSGANDVQLTNNIATVLAASSVGNNLTVLSNGAITQTGALIVSGLSSFTAGANAITLTNASNNFTGAVSLNNSGANNVALTDVNALVMGASSVGSGSLTLNSVGITQSGAITSSGAATINAGAGVITLGSANNFSGTVSLNNSGANNVSLTNNIALTLGASSVGSGTLGITAGGSITQSGAITQAASAGAASFGVTAAASDILLNTQANNFSGSIGFSGTLTNIRDVGLRNINAAATLASFAGLTNLRNLTIVFDNSALSLPAITLASGGSFSGTAGGAITQTGILTVPGTASFSAGANAITLTQNNAITGAVSFSNSGSNNISLTNTIATVLGASSIGNNLTVVSSGALTQTGALIIPGIASFTAGANAITLTNASNNFTGAVSLSNSGANNVALTDVNALVMGASSVGSGTLTLNSVGLTQTGAITSSGAATINAGAGVITLGSANNFSGSVSLNNSGANNVSLVNSGALVLAASSVGSGTLGITAGGSITQSGAITQAASAGAASFGVTAAASDILLNTQANNFSGAIGFSGTLTNIRDVGLRNINASATLASFAGLTNLRNLTIVFDNSALSLPAITLASGGSFSGTAGGAITQTGALTVPGTASFTAGANAITLTQNNVITGVVSFSNSGTNNISLTNTIATVLGASSIGNNLTVLSSGAITQNAALVVPGLASFTAGANAITLTNASNNFTGAVSLNNSGANNVALTDVNALVMGASSVGSGSLTLNSVGITQTGVITSSGAATINAGAGVITLGSSNNFSGSISLNNSGANNVSLTNAAAVSLNSSSVGSGTLNISAGGNISQIGAITQAASAGTATFSAGANAITLTNASNDFTGSVVLSNSGANNVSLTDVNALSVGASSLGTGTLTLTSVGLTQTGAITQGAAAGDVTINAGAGVITLSNSSNNLTGDVFLNNSGANNVILVNNTLLSLGTSVLGSGSLSLTANGQLSQVGAITQAAGAGAVTLTQNQAGGDILLGTAANDFSGSMSFGGTLSNIHTFSLRNINSGASLPTNLAGLSNLFNLTLEFDNAGMSFPAVTVANNLSAIANGAITQIGALTVGGTSSFTAGSHAITLSSANAFTGEVSLSNSGANNVAITNTIHLGLGTVTVGSGTLGLTGLGVSQSGIITQASGASQVTVNAGAGVIALGNNNVFTGDVSVNNTGANDVSLTDTTPLVLAASNVGSGELNLVSGGSLSETGALIQESNAGAISISLTVPDSDILMDTQMNDTNGSIIITGTTANLRDVARRNINANAGTLISNIGLLTNLRNLTIIFDNASLIAQAVTLHNGGNLYVDTSGSLSGGTGGSITQTGVVTVPGTTTLLSGNHSITLTQNNLLTGAISVSNSGTNDVSITNAQATALGTSSVGRDLSIASSGAITQTGVLTVPGAASFSAGANAITLTQANAFNGAVSLSNSGANNVSLINSTALNLGTTTIGQNLSLIAGGSISQSGLLTATGGTTTVATTVAGSDILLGSFANNLGTSALLFGGTASNIRDLSLRNVNAGATLPSFAALSNLRNLTLIFNNAAMALPAISLASSGNLSITAGGNITQTGAFNVPGTASFTTGASPITLTNASNSMTGAISVFNSGALNVAITNNIATVLGTSSVGNNLTVISNGAITQTGALTVPQLSSFTAGANPITLSQNNVLSGAVSLNNSGANDVQLTNANALVIGTSNIGSGALALTAGGTISQTGAITQEANAAVATFSFTSPDSDLLLTTSVPNYFTSDFNVGGTLANLRDFSIWNAGTGDSVVLNLLLLTNLRNVTLVEDNLANLTIPALTLHNGGNLSINTSGLASGGTGGNIIQTGVITVPGTTSLNAGAHSIILTENNQFTGAVSLNNTGANNISLTNAIALNLGTSNVGSGSLTLNSLGITQSGALIQAAGASAVTVNAGAGVITLTNAANHFVGAVSLNNSGANNVSLSNNTDLSLAASSVGTGTLNITAVGDITQTGVFTQAASAGAATFNAGSHAITLTQANQFTGAVSLNNSGANNVALVNSIALVLGTSSVGTGTLNITAGGDITQSGAFTQAISAGDVSINAGANGIALTQTNHFTGNIALSNSGANDVSLTNDTGISFNTTSIGSGAFTVIAGGNITQLGILTQEASAGDTTLNAGANAISLGLSNHITGAVLFNNSGNNNVSLVNDSLLTLGTSSVGSGTLSLTGVGVVQSGSFTQAASAGAVTVNAGAGVITLNNASNQFTGTVALNNSGANNVAIVNNAALSLAAASLGSGTFSITANGLLNQTGALTQASGAGAVTLTQNASGADILLNTAANNLSGTVAFGGTLGNIRDFGFRNTNSVATLPTNLSGLSGLRNLTLVFNNAAMSLPAITASGNLSVTASGSITQTGALSITGTPTFTSTALSSDILLASNANNFVVTPVITNNGNVRDLALRNTAATAVVPTLPTGMRNLTLIFNNAAMALPGVSLTGNLVATANGAITQTGALDMDNAGTALTLSAGSGNDITLDNIANFIEEVSIISGRNVSLVNADISDFALGASTISGTFNLVVSSPVTQTGAVSVSGAATITTDSTKNITLTNSGNDFSSLGIVSGNNVSLRDSNSLALNASTISGNLSVITQGDLTQNGVISNANAGGTTTFTANSGNITLANTSNDFHEIIINSANDVSLSDANNLEFGLTSLAGNLTVVTSGNITQNAAMTVNGIGKVASFDAGNTGNITLTHVPNDFSAIIIPNAFAVNVLDVNDLEIGNISIKSNLFSQVGGSLTTTGLIQTTGGNVDLSTTGNGVITIGTSAQNIDGILTTAVGGLSSGNITITAANTDGLPVALTVNRVLNTTGGSGGILSVGGGISLNETPIVGAGNITLSASSNETFLGNLNFIVPTTIQYSNTDIVINGTITTTGIGSSLTIIADANNTGIGGIRSTATGSINSSDDLTLQASNLISSPGTAIFLIDGSTFTAAGNINILGNIGSNLIHIHANVESTGANKAITITPTGTADIDFGGTLTTNGGDINLNGNPLSAFVVHNDVALVTNGGVINANAITGPGHSITFSVGSGTNLILTNAANDFDTVAITSANDVQLVDMDSIDLAASTISGDLSLTTGGDITNTAGNISVAGVASLTALNSGSISLAQAGNDFSSVAVSAADNLTLADTNAIDLGPINIAGTLSVSAAGNITQLGGAIIVNGIGKLASFSAGSANDITLNNASNDFYALALDSGNNATIRDTNALILADINLAGDFNLTTNGAITQNNAMILSGATKVVTITTGSSNDITLGNAGNNFRNLVINSGRHVSVTDIGNLNFGTSSISGNFVGHTNGYTQTGALTILGTSTFDADSGAITLGGANNFTGAVLLTNAGNNNVLLNNSGLLTIGGGLSSVGSGTLTLSGLGVIQTGAITQEAAAGNVTINAGAGVITLTNAGNDFTGSVLLNNSGANNISLTNSNALDLGTSTVGSGSLALVSGGDITQSGVLTQASSAGALTLSATTAASNINLSTQANVITGAVTFGGTLGNIRDVALRNTSSTASAPTNLSGLTNLRNLSLIFNNAAISLPTITLTNSGNLSVTANGITQTGVLTVPGTASFIAGNNAINLSSANVFTGVISLSNSGATNNVSLTNSIATVLAASSVGNNLTISSGGALTQTGILTVPGASSFSAGANTITLSQNNALTGAVSLSNTSANSVSLMNNGALNLGTTSVGSALNLFVAGHVTQSGVITATGGSVTITSTVANTDIALGSFANDFGSHALVFGGSLSNIRDITLRNISSSAVLPSFTGLSALRNLSISFDAAGINIPTLTLTNSGNLTLVAGGDITQTGAITVPGTSSFSALSNAITLTNASNAFTGAVTLTNSGNHNVALRNSGLLTMAASNVGIGSLSLTGAGLAQTGAIIQAAGAGAVTLNAGAAAINFSQANQFTGAVSLQNSGNNNVTLTNALALNLGASSVGIGTLSITAGGHITESGALVQAANAGNITLAVTSPNSDILLNTQANNITGVVNYGGTTSNIRDVGYRNISTAADANGLNLFSLSNLRNATIIFDNAAVTLPALTLHASGNLYIDASGSLSGGTGGAITQTGVAVVPGTTTLIAGNHLINMGQDNALTGAISFSNTGSNDVNLKNTIATVLGTSSIGQNLTINAGGAITQTGAFTVPGTSSFSAGANAILLSQANAFTGAVSLSNSGANDIQLTNANALVIGTTNIGSGSVGLTAGGTISQVGAITQEANAGIMTFTFTAPNADLLLSTTVPNYITSYFNVAGTLGNLRDVTIWNAASTGGVVLNLQLLTSLRNLTITYDNVPEVSLPALTLHNGGSLIVNTSGAASGGTGGNITQTGILTIPGTTTLTAGAHSIILTENNQFSGAVTLSNTGANNISINNTIALNLGTANVGSGTLTLSGLGVTQSGGLIQEVGAGAVTINAGAGAITLTNTANNFVGSVSLNNSGANNVSIRNGTSLALGTSILGTGALTITATGNITQTGAITQAAGAGAITLTSLVDASDIILNLANTLTGSLSIGGNVTFIHNLNLRNIASNASLPTNLSSLTDLRNLTVTFDNAGVTLPSFTLFTGGNLSVNAGGAITQSGVITVPGTTSLVAGNHAITLTLNNVLTGALSLTNSGANHVAVKTTGLLNLGNVSVGSGTLTLTGVGITQGGANTITQAASAGAAVFNAGAGTINLANNNLLTGSVSLNNSGVNNVTLKNAMNLVLGTSSVGSGSLSLTSAGNITQTGAITQASGAANVTLASTTPNSDILLNTAANDFTGSVVFTGTLANIRDVGLRNINASVVFSPSISLLSNLRNLTLVFNNAAISLPAITLHNSGSLAVTAGGAITQTGALIANTVSALTTGGIMFTNASNAFNAIQATNNVSGDIQIVSTTNPLTLNGLANNGSGNISVTVTGGEMQLGNTLTTNGGDIALNSPLILTGNASITSNSGLIDFNAAVNGAHILTLNAGSSGDITFNEDVGLVTPLSKLVITNAHDITNNATMSLGQFVQNAGNILDFGLGGVTTTNNASITGSNVLGEINVASLSLGTDFANITGLIAGGSGKAAIQTVVFLNTITAGTHFFNGIDMFLTPTPPVPPVPPAPVITNDSTLPQTVLPDGLTVVQGAYAFLMTDDAWLVDWLAANPLYKECTTVTSDIAICRN